MPPRRSNRLKKKQPKKLTPPKKQPKKKLKFNERKEYQIHRKIMLPHTINKRSVFMTQFKGQRYELDEIKEFVTKLKGAFQNSGQVKNIQIGFGFDSGKHYSNRWTDIENDLDIRDFRGLYSDDDSTITSFTIFIS